MSLFATWLEFFAGLLDASIGLVLIVKWTAVLALAWLAHGMLAGRNPRWRVALWRSAIVGLALVAVLSLAPPIVTYQSRRREISRRSKSRRRFRPRRPSRARRLRRSSRIGSRRCRSVPRRPLLPRL